MKRLVLSADVSKASEVLSLAKKLAPFLHALKIHSDALLGFDQRFVNELLELKAKYGLLLFEDRKFADIGATVQKQFNNSPFLYEQWVDLVTVHSLSGQGPLDALLQSKRQVKVLLLGQMSCQSPFFDEAYFKKTCELAKKCSNIAGLIAQSKPSFAQNFQVWMPGISDIATDDSLLQRYKTIEQATLDGADFYIVGRALYQADNPQRKAALLTEQIATCRYNSL